MTVTILQNVAKNRRSIYTLNKNLPINQEQLEQIINHAIKNTPSSFNSQSTRLAVLLNEEHEKLWEFTAKILSEIVNNDDKFQTTANKLSSLKSASGTIIFFEDQNVIKNLQEKYPTYAEKIPIWSEHNNAMHQYALWTTLAAANVGANLQHYNPLIDQIIEKNWNIPSNWQNCAQLVFGGIEAPAKEKTFMSVEDRLKIIGKLA